MISPIHESKVRATMKHVKVDTGFVVKDVQEYLLKLFQVENVVYGFEPGKKKSEVTPPLSCSTDIITNSEPINSRILNQN